MTRQETTDALLAALVVLILAAALWLILPAEVKTMLGTLGMAAV